MKSALILFALVGPALAMWLAAPLRGGAAAGASSAEACCATPEECAECCPDCPCPCCGGACCEQG